jgi:hypothetical protein
MVLIRQHLLPTGSTPKDFDKGRFFTGRVMPLAFLDIDGRSDLIVSKFT